MRTQLVLTLIGRDRPGLVEAVAAEVARHDGNWEASRMARLAGHFAGLLHVSVPAEARSSLTHALEQLADSGLKLVVEPVDAELGPSTGQRLRLELVGSDREGIVRDLARVLVRHNVNVEELQTACEAAPMAGGTLFRAHALVRLPPDFAADTLRGALEALADDLMVELTVDTLADDRQR